MSVFSDAVARMDVAVLRVHADDVEYFPRVGDPYTLTGVMDSGEAVQNNEKVYQTLWAPLANFTEGEPMKNDSVTYGGVTYRVADIEKDAQGGRLIKLSVSMPR